jgi:tetratricopeptide (TPR) repeat protein
MTTSSQEAYRHYLAGVDFCRRGFPFEGRGEFELALKADSTMAMAYYWLVRERLDVSRSAEYIGKALRYSENLPEREQLMIKALAESHNGNLQAAANILERLCLEDTSDYATLEEYALALNQLPEIHDSVIAIRKRQIAAFPEKHEFLDVIAGLFKNIRVFDSALVYSARQVALAPGEPRSHDTHAEVLLANGKYEEAIHSYRTSLSLAPTYHSTLVVIGKLYAHLGDSRRSDSCVLAHMRAGGADHRSTARLNLANPLRYSGEFSKTIQILNDGINSDSLEGEPSRTRTYTQKFLVKAIALDYLGRTEEALEVIEAAKRVARDIAPIEIVKPLHYEAIYRAERGNLEAAQAAVDSADSLVGNRRSGLVYSFRTLAHAWVFYRKGDVAHAIDDFLAPKNKLLRPVWEHYLARLYVEIGQPKDAIPLLQDWLARIENVDFQEPEMFVTSHYYLGRAYESLGESDSAIVHYSRFLNYWGKSPDDIPLVKDTRNRLAQLTS